MEQDGRGEHQKHREASKQKERLLLGTKDKKVERKNLSSPSATTMGHPVPCHFRTQPSSVESFSDRHALWDGSVWNTSSNGLGSQGDSAEI